MKAIVPWSAPYEVIEPYDIKAGKRRPPIGVNQMLRIHFVRH